MDIRNVAIIAHVDHGKTTLVDALLKQTHTFRDNEAAMSQTTILDSNDLEREKGITILAKTTSVEYKGTKVNIIDTPGHADFSGEVERVINMADGAILIVDAAEGPLPQTEFVLRQAFKCNLPIIVVINKIDRKDARPAEVLSEIETLFLHLAEHEGHLDFPVLYAVGRNGVVWDHLPASPDESGDTSVLFEKILSVVPPPPGDPTKPFKMLVSNLDFDDYKGVYAIGKIVQGTVKPGDKISILLEDETVGKGTVGEIFSHHGLKRQSVPEGVTGDIVDITGLPDVAIGLTLTDPADPHGFPRIVLEEPTLKITIGANTSPFAAREGDFVTARQLGARLIREQKTNIGLRISENPGGSSFVVAGRGELHLAVLLETMRREGYEMEVGKPEVIFRKDGETVREPYEELTVDIDTQFIGVITEEMGKRRAELLDTRTDDRGITRIVYKVSSRNLIGFRGDILTRTRGRGIFSTRLIGYEPVGKDMPSSRNGVFISLENGRATNYALMALQARGASFILPGTDVYEGMIVGANNRQEDIEINIIKFKKLTNIHSEVSDVAVQLDPPVIMSIEQCLDFLADDELLEITPKSLRLRKKFLTHTARVRTERGQTPTI